MKKLAIFLIVICLLSLCLLSCGKDGGASPAESGSSEGEVIIKTDSIDISKMKLCRADKASMELKSAISALSSEIEAATGTKPGMTTDWNSRTGGEIIIGSSKREATKEAMGLLKTDYDFVIKKVGSDIVILGLTDESTLDAIEYFKANFIKNGKVSVPLGDGYLYKMNIKLDSLTVAGKDISEFSFLYVEKGNLRNDQTTFDEVTAISERLKTEYIGELLPLVPTMRKGESYIIYDRSGLDYEKGSIYVEDGNLILHGSYHSIGAVMDYFFGTLLESGKDINIAEDYYYELSTSDLPTVYSKDDLMQVLEYVYNTNDLLIVGDEVNNSREMPFQMLENYKNGKEGGYPGTDTYPSIMGLDLGRCGFKLPTIPEGQWITVSQMICECIEYAAQGGIITIGNHMTNPNPQNIPEGETEERGDLGDEQAWINLVTEGTEENTRFRSELELNAIVLKALDDAGVPIIWRPFHECNGGWFWWTPELGSTKYDSKYFVDMWVYMYEYFTEEMGIGNLIWEYSPSNSEHMDVMYLYPGDDYCDIVGIDWYTAGNFEIVNNDFYEKLMETGKVVNLAEFGISSSSIICCETQEEQARVYDAEAFIGNAYSMYYEDYKIGYLMSYAGKTGLMWLPGADKVMKDKRVLDLSEMLSLFEEVTGFKP